jgi:hypothetical protein
MKEGNRMQNNVKYFSLNPKLENYNEEFSHAITENETTIYYSRWNSTSNKIVTGNKI